MEIINGYELIEPLQNKNAGFSKWTFAKKNGKEYFIKEFLDPVYPMDQSISEDLKIRKIHECEEVQLRKKQLYKEINEFADGNLVRINEYFRYDTHYYVVTDKIESMGLTCKSIQEYSYENRFLLCKSIAHSIMELHRANVVHSDLKETNILLTTSKTGQLLGKIIDFDCSFFNYNPPKYEDELSGDFIYLAPEACQFIFGDSVRLDSKIDVFALGLLFHQYLSGELPEFDTDEYDYAYEVVLDDQKLELSETIPAEVRAILEQMLKCDPSERIEMEDVFNKFVELDESLTEITEEAKLISSKGEKIKDSSMWFQPASDADL